MKTKRLPIVTGNHMIDNERSGEWLQSRPGERFSIRVPASATNGSYSVTEILSSPGDSTPAHLHENEDEHILVTDTPIRLMITARPGGMEEVLRLIATLGNQLDPLTLSNKYAIRLTGPPLLGAVHRERG